MVQQHIHQHPFLVRCCEIILKISDIQMCYDAPCLH